MDNKTKESIEHTLGLYGPDEAREVLRRLESGEVDGSNFAPSDRNPCACLLGTMEHARDPTWDLGKWDTDQFFGLSDANYDATTLAQDWFFPIRPGHTVHNNGQVEEAYRVIQDWLRRNERPVTPKGIKAKGPLLGGIEPIIRPEV
jgi:hypothetical protein